MQGHDESAPMRSRSDSVLISCSFGSGKEKGGKEDDLRSGSGVSYMPKEIWRFAYWMDIRAAVDKRSGAGEKLFLFQKKGKQCA